MRTLLSVQIAHPPSDFDPALFVPFSNTPAIWNVHLSHIETTLPQCPLEVTPQKLDDRTYPPIPAGTYTTSS